MKRSGKFYYRNEKDVAKALGLQPVPGSGSGWIHKEDMESDEVLVQLKSTDAESYRINLLDIKKLEYHASVSNKIPIFLVQFLQHSKIYAIVEIGNIDGLQELTRNNKTITLPVNDSIVPLSQDIQPVTHQIIKSSNKAKNKFYKEKEEKYGKRK